MNIWKPESVKEEPEVVLGKWQIYEVESELWEGKTRHFVGYNYVYNEGRISSAIIEFDKEKMIGKTKSGRIYKLKGDPGNNLDSAYVWTFWRKRNKITSYKLIDIKKLIGLENNE